MTEKRKLEYHKTYMRMAYEFSKLSQAKRSKVGCLIVSPNGQIISQGFNGMPKGMDNECEYLDDNGCSKTKREVMHAETNAILKCARDGGRTDGCTLYITLSPCFDCAKVIIQAGISKIYYAEEYRDTSGLDLLKNSGIECIYLPIETEIESKILRDKELYYAVHKDGTPCIVAAEEPPHFDEFLYAWVTSKPFELYPLRDNTIMNITSFGDQEWYHPPVRISK